jgi:hypothetical protein
MPIRAFLLGVLVYTLAQTSAPAPAEDAFATMVSEAELRRYVGVLQEGWSRDGDD